MVTPPITAKTARHDNIANRNAAGHDEHPRFAAPSTHNFSLPTHLPSPGYQSCSGNVGGCLQTPFYPSTSSQPRRTSRAHP